MEEFDVWCYGKMMNMNWVDRITNEDVLNRMHEVRLMWKLKRRDRIVVKTRRASENYYRVDIRS